MINIDAKLFWDEFYSLCQIPRASHYPDKIIPYLKNKIKLYGFEPIIDKNNNIFFTIPATNGYEKSPITLLQAHADMVGVKTKNSSHDFKNDAIKTLNNNGKLSAQDTSLGADNGIGLAYILTIVSQNKNLIHPTLEILITWNEEVIPQSITFFDTSLIKASYMINLDNEDIKKCEIGCAGVNNEVFSIDIKTEKFLKPSAVKFTIEGLLGGHSGAYIGNLRGNAIKLGFEILYQAMSQNIKINLLHCASSIPLNVIPSEFEIIIDINDNDMKKLEDIATTYLKKYQNIYTEEKNIKFHFQKITDFSSYSNSYISAEITSKIINFFAAIPDGVLLYNEKLQMYEISYNLAQITMKENIMQFGYSLRSTNVNAHVHFKQKISALLDLGNLSWKSLETQSSSVAWTPIPENKIANIYHDVFFNIMHIHPVNEVCKGGLECGFIVNRLPHIQAIAIGPDIYEPHSTNEWTTIASCDQLFNILIELLGHIS